MCIFRANYPFVLGANLDGNYDGKTLEKRTGTTENRKKNLKNHALCQKTVQKFCQIVMKKRNDRENQMGNEIITPNKYPQWDEQKPCIHHRIVWKRVWNSIFVSKFNISTYPIASTIGCVVVFDMNTWQANRGSSGCLVMKPKYLNKKFLKVYEKTARSYLSCLGCAPQKEIFWRL